MKLIVLVLGINTSVYLCILGEIYFDSSRPTGN